MSTSSADTVLPGYSAGSSAHHRASTSAPPRSRRRTEHSYCLTGRDNKPWLTLKVSSHAPTPAHLPTFYEGETIHGTVELDLDREETIKAVVVSIKGRITTSAVDVFDFLDLSQELWPGPADGGAAPASGSSKRKLHGKHAWPFALELPRRVTLGSTAYALPPSFSERMTRVHIQYQLAARVRRGRLRPDSDVATVLGYLPLTGPDPPSPARQAAYLGRTALVGPDADPAGWLALDPVKVRGTIFSTRTVEATCTLWLATPLCYTRGTVIPCVVSIRSQDPQAVDVLSSPKAPVVHLRRHISIPIGNVSSIPGKSVRGIPFEPTVEDLKAAVFQPMPKDREDPARELHGEIHLAAGLKPSCELGDFTLSYSVALYAPRAVAFTPEGSPKGALCSVTVDIVTAHAAGPRPIAYSPPEYGDSSSSSHRSEFNLFRGVSG